MTVMTKLIKCFVMKSINRRQFIGKSAIGAGTALALSLLPKQLLAQSIPQFKDIPIGFQTFPIRDILAKDFAGTLKMMADMGYRYTEMCSPQGYATIGYGAFANM